VEIERRFVVDRLPAGLTLGEGTAMRQGYLSAGGTVTVRVRITATGAVLTVKAGNGLARTEVEVPLPMGEAEDLWPHTRGRSLSKTRHHVTLSDGTRLDLDLYHDTLEGLITIEVEFPDVASAECFTPPVWFGTEVTGRPEWSNAALARSGRPE
jgi:CYTH domain-containing protein